MEDYRQENQLLKNKIKMLQQEIRERTRNFMMQYNLNKNKIHHQEFIDSYVQTDQIVKQQDRYCDMLDKGQLQYIKVLSLQQNHFDAEWSSPQQTTTVTEGNQDQAYLTQNSQTHANHQQDEKGVNEKSDQTEQVRQQLINYLLISIKNSQQQDTLKSRERIIKKLNEQNIIINQQFIKQIQNKIIKFYQINLQEINHLHLKISKISQELNNAQIRCEFITKGLYDSEEVNYQLRVKNQQYELKLRKNEEMKGNQDAKLKQMCIQQLKSKISQMQIMKKQYLRAYSKIKQEKQGLESKVSLLTSQLQKKSNHKVPQEHPKQQHKQQLKQQQKNSLEQQHEAFSVVIQDDNRLQTIVEHSEDQHLEQIIRKTSYDYSIAAIKQIIQHSLMQNNRATSQKWIKTALLKLQQYEQQQHEDQQKLTESQVILQASMQQDYKNLLLNVKKATSKQKIVLQQQFNNSISKLIKNFEQRKQNELIQNISKYPQLINNKKISQFNVEQLSISSIRQLDKIQKFININQDIYHKELFQDQQLKDNCQSIDFMVKLNQCQAKYADLKKKYDSVTQKNQYANSRVLIRQRALQTDFKNFMQKLTESNTKKQSHTKLQKQYFTRLSNKIFETLCNLPTGKHGNIFFIPNNEQQLQYAIEVMYNFSLQYDKYQQAKTKQFKKGAQNLTKIIQKIAIDNQVPTQQIISSVTHQIDQQNYMMNNIVNKLIRKLSTQQNNNKGKIKKDSKSFQAKN